MRKLNLNTIMKHLLLISSIVILLAACSSTRGLDKTGTPSTQTENTAQAYTRRVLHNAQTKPCITARVSVDIKAFGKDVGINGSLKMKRDDVIQLSLSLMGFEVGRLEFTPDTVLIIDRINKQYVQARYSDVDFLRGADLDFYALQAMFWNEIFVPGQRNTALAIDRFRVTESGDHTLLHLVDAKKLDYSFLTATKAATLNRLTVISQNSKEEGQVICRYSNFAPLDKKPFPQNISLDFKGNGQSFAMEIGLSGTNNNTKWDYRTTIPAKYKPRDARSLLKQLLP